MTSVASREYKVILNPEKFGSKKLLKGTQVFWDKLVKAVNPISVEGALEIDKERLITFYDTKDFFLFRQRYVFRKRTKSDGKKPEYTLKFRHPDRFVSENRIMSSRENKKDPKFEEDIKPGFTSLYSYSSTISGKSADKLRLADVMALYPDLSRRLTSSDIPDPKQTLKSVGYTAYEVVLAHERLFVVPDLPVECAFVVWYDADRTSVALVEFSFRYKLKDIPLDRMAEISECAFQMFVTLQSMDEYVPGGITKTRYMYRNAGYRETADNIR